jgi:hypothetical protein
VELKKFENDLSKELVSNSGDLLVDLADIGINNVLDDGIINEIPILKTIASVCKIGLNIRDRFFAKKIVYFIASFSAGQKDADKYNKFISEMNNDKFRSKVTEQIIITVDRLDTALKAQIISNFLISLINEKITWDDFMQFSNIVNYLTEVDYEALQLLYKEQNNHVCFKIYEKNYLEGAAYKLVQFNLVTYEVVSGMVFGTMPATILHKISSSGIKFYDNYRRM